MIEERMRYFILVFILVFILLGTTQTWPQETAETAVITGRITDQRTGEPVENVNVYLANTTRGGWSASDGHFVIRDVPLGKSELVISRVGYARIVAPLTIVRAETLSLAYELSESMVEIEEVSVTEERDEQWEQNLQRFRDTFLGSSRFAGECVILNPEVLDLTYDNDTLIARSGAPLRIENRALGYRIIIVFDRFVWNVDHDYGSYKIYPFFEELTPADRVEASDWTENREAAWKGSLRHFLSTLYHGNSESDLFFIHSGTLKKLVSGQGHRVLSSEFRSDSIGGTDYREFTIANPLRIEYGYQESGVEPPLRKSSRNIPKTAQLADPSTVNILMAPDSVIVIDPRGNLFDPLKVEVAGGWGRSRVAELLPAH